jgi:hypothetical protein
MYKANENTKRKSEIEVEARKEYGKVKISPF